MRISDWSADVCSSDLHVHGHRLHLRAAFRPEQLEERTDFGTGTAAAYPQHPLALHVDHHGRVAMALLDRELVHRDPTHTVQVHRTHGALQGPEINDLCGLPVVPMPAVGMQHGGRLTPPGPPAAPPPPHPSFVIPPVTFL